ncbi:MAG: cyanophycin synthetase [Actinomycetes bacterium]
MRIDSLRRLRGPNRLSSQPVLVAVVELEELSGRRPTEVPGFVQRLGGLLEALPALGSASSAGAAVILPRQRGGGGVPARRRADDGLPAARTTSFEKVAEHVLSELCRRIGRETTLARTQPSDDPGTFQLTLGCPPDEWVEDPTAEDLLQLALDVIEAAASSHDAPEAALAAELTRIKGVFEEGRLGVSTAELTRAARQRDIPVRRLSDAALLQLGTGRHRRLLWAATTDITSSIGVDIASDKDLTHQLLEAAGIPVPAARLVRTADEARAAFSRLGPPVVVKPLCGHHGLDVFVELQTLARTIEAYQAVGPEGTSVLVERYTPGRDYRVLVVGGRMRAAAELTPPQVTGDGKATIAQLVEAVNRDPRRGDGHDRPLTRIVLDDMSLAHLCGQGYSPDSVLQRGETVRLRRNANLSTGGTSRDVTDLVHPDIARACVRAAAVMSLDVCGIDLRERDIAAPMTPGHTDAAVIEVNASPGLRMHLYPSEGRPRDVAADLVDHVFPPHAPSRVPVVSVTGTNGKTTTVRLVAAIMGGAGSTVGLASTEGVYVDDELVYAADASGPRSAEMVLGNPAVEVAVLETARGGIARRGLGYDWADVAVVTNIGRDHIGSDGVRDLADLVEVKAVVAERIRLGGTVVLNADDRNSAGLACRPAVVQRAPDVRLFSLDANNLLVAQHLDAGGTAYLLDGEGWLVEAEHDTRRPIIGAEEMPVAFCGHAPFNIANALAATAASRALGVDMGDVARTLASFDPDRDNPGRGNLVRVRGVPVVVDYAHNAAALTAVAGLVTARWGTDAVAVITLPGDRPDALVLESARAVGEAFGRVVVYEDLDLRGRRPGEMAALIRSGVSAARPSTQVLAAGSLEEAAETALTLAAPADPVLIVYEHLDPLLTLLRRLQAAEPAANAAR